MTNTMLLWSDTDQDPELWKMQNSLRQFATSQINTKSKIHIDYSEVAVAYAGTEPYYYYAFYSPTEEETGFAAVTRASMHKNYLCGHIHGKTFEAISRNIRSFDLFFDGEFIGQIDCNLKYAFYADEWIIYKKDSLFAALSRGKKLAPESLIFSPSPDKKCEIRLVCQSGSFVNFCKVIVRLITFSWLICPAECINFILSGKIKNFPEEEQNLIFVIAIVLRMVFFRSDFSSGD